MSSIDELIRLRRKAEAERDALRIALADAAIRLRAVSHWEQLTSTPAHKEQLRRWADEADAAFHAHAAARAALKPAVTDNKKEPSNG